MENPIKVVNIYRKKNNLTQNELAEKLGVSLPTIKRYEKDNKHIPISRLKEMYVLLYMPLKSVEFIKKLGLDKEYNEFLELEERVKEERKFEYFINYLEREYTLGFSNLENLVMAIPKEVNLEEPTKYIIKKNKLVELDNKLKQIVREYLIEEGE